MVNVDCAGDQDRNTTTSETHPNIPPRKTRNCYLSDPLNTGIGFDRSLCGTSSDRACSGIAGGINACEPDKYGGYCKNNNQYFVSKGNIFSPLTQADLINRYKGDSNTDTDIVVNRALNEQERKFNNRIRELQIMGKDPLVRQNNKDQDNKDQNNKDQNNKDNEVHGFISDLLTKIGIGFSVIMFIISSCVILIQNKII